MSRSRQSGQRSSRQISASRRHSTDDDDDSIQHCQQTHKHSSRSVFPAAVAILTAAFVAFCIAIL